MGNFIYVRKTKSLGYVHNKVRTKMLNNIFKGKIMYSKCLRVNSHIFLAPHRCNFNLKRNINKHGQQFLRQRYQRMFKKRLQHVLMRLRNNTVEPLWRESIEPLRRETVNPMLTLKVNLLTFSFLGTIKQLTLKHTHPTGFNSAKTKTMTNKYMTSQTVDIANSVANIRPHIQANLLFRSRYGKFLEKQYN